MHLNKIMCIYIYKKKLHTFSKGWKDENGNLKSCVFKKDSIYK